MLTSLADDELYCACKYYGHQTIMHATLTKN